MTKEKDPLADYFPTPEEEYAAYKKRKREKEEKEKIEKETMAHHKSDNNDFEKASSKEQNETTRDFNIYETSLPDDVCEEIDKYADPYVAYCDYMASMESDDVDNEEEDIYKPIYGDEYNLDDNEDDDMCGIQNRKGYNSEELAQRNKVAKSLVCLKKELGDDLYDPKEVQERIKHIGIYNFDPETLSLQKAVDFSRMRVASHSKITMRIYRADQDRIMSFLSDTYNMSEIAIVFHRLYYPDDYQFVNSNWNTEFDSCFNDICEGVHTFDYVDVDLDDIETWPVNDITDIDVDVEFEVNFQKALASLRQEIGNGDGTRIDIGLRIPYSQISKATTYEIRLINLLVELNYIPRVSVCIFRNDMEEDIRACVFITFLKLWPKPSRS